MTMIDALEPCPDCGSHHHKSCRTINARQKAEHKLNLELQKLLLRKKAMPPMNKPNAPGEGSELPDWVVEIKEAAEAGKRADTDYGQSFIRRNADLAKFESAATPENIIKLISQLKAALSSPQQESAEFTEAKKLLIEAREMRNLFVRADQNHGSKSADTMSEKADEIFYRILEFNKRVAPPVTAEGKANE